MCQHCGVDTLILHPGQPRLPPVHGRVKTVFKHQKMLVALRIAANHFKYAAAVDAVYAEVHGVRPKIYELTIAPVRPALLCVLRLLDFLEMAVCARR